jgi:ABC-type polysaccharide/polyol phosphate transport system ATPase subunit
MPEAMIRVEGLSKLFKIPKEPARTAKEAVIRFLKRKSDYEEFWALRDVSFTVNRGEAVGIIGRNGSGKSTLFKLVSGVLVPTNGSIVVNGRVSPMIELTAGFHPELTGMENVFLNGAIYGMSRAEVRRKLDAIIDFAGIGDFIYSPSRVYSSGMLARLGFAIAVNVDADILLVDEVLSVGDADFQHKCIAKIKELKENDITIVYVSHDMNTVKNLCDRTLFLNSGEIVMDGNTDDIVDKYLDLIAQY